MVFAVESIVACVLFTVLLEIATFHRREVFVNDYPPVVTEKLRQMGLIAEKPPAKRSDMIRKMIAFMVYAVLFSLLLRYVNGITTLKSWKNQDYCLIGKKTDYNLFKRTDMHLWYGVKGAVDKKLSAQLEELKSQGYPFQYKIFTELGHSGLAGEHPEQFLEEMIRAHEV